MVVFNVDIFYVLLVFLDLGSRIKNKFKVLKYKNYLFLFKILFISHFYLLLRTLTINYNKFINYLILQI